MRASKYLSVAKISVTERFLHSSNLVGRAVVVIARIGIFSALYHATYRAAGVSVIGGVDVTGVVWMLVFTQAFRQSAWPNVAALIDEEVKSGSLAHSINRPYSYELFHFASFFGRLGPNLLVNLGSAAVAGLIFVGPLHVTLASLSAGTVLLTLSFVLDFLCCFSIGILAFWVEDTSAFQWIFFKGQLVFGGLILPLTLFPSGLRSVAEKLPFAAMYYSAARTLVGFDQRMFERYLLIQLVWIAIAASVAWLLFRKGVRNVELNGG